ncbi:phage coat protein [Photobacterium profundum]|uniref:phage coat protein n=1 Tax=Photobacterium profundum TaxID=74109 RepID=UPI003D10640E
MKKMNLVKFTAPVLAAVSSVGAHAADEASGIFAAVDFAGYATFIGTAGAAIIGIAMAVKAISVGKRAVSKA